MSKSNTNLVICLRAVLGFACVSVPSWAWADASVGALSESLMGPTEIITQLVLAACYMVGVGLVIFSLAQYKQHRQSPKLVPLSTPILLLILGVLALLIPYITTLPDESGSATEVAKREGKTAPKSGALAPTSEYESRKLPGPGRYAPRDVPNDSEYPDEEYEVDDVPSSGHWTDDY